MSSSSPTAFLQLQFGQNIGLAILVALVQKKKLLSFAESHEHLDHNRSDQSKQGRVEGRRQTSGYVLERILDCIDVCRLLNGIPKLAYGGTQAQNRSDEPENGDGSVKAIDQTVTG